MASVITIAGEKLFAAKAQANEQLDIDTFIFANVPAQDATAPINREEGLPADHVVHQQIVQQVGRINDNVVVYSTVLDSITGPFEFNWVGLYSSINNTLVAINHIPTTPKTKTEAGVAGNTLNRNFGIEYSGIADLTGIDVAPETWQLDFTARLQGMDKLTQQLAKDLNGADSFIDDGFKVVSRTTANTFSVMPGVGYVNGLRVEILESKVLIADSYPKNVYVDACFTGDASSTWKPEKTIKITEGELNDFVDEGGKEHYLVKIAVLNSASEIDDLRISFTDKYEKNIRVFESLAAAISYESSKENQIVQVLDKNNAQYEYLYIESEGAGIHKAKNGLSLKLVNKPSVNNKDVGSTFEAIKVQAERGGGVVYLNNDEEELAGPAAINSPINDDKISIRGTNKHVSVLRTNFDDPALTLRESYEVSDIGIKSTVKGKGVGLATPNYKQTQRSTHESLRFDNLKYGIWNRYSFNDSYKNIHFKDCDVGMYLARSGYQLDNGNPEPTKGWNMGDDGFFHNVISMSNIIADGGECGIYAVGMCMGLDNITCQNQRTDGVNNKILPDGQKGTGLVIDSAYDSSKSGQWGNVIHNYYSEECKVGLRVNNQRYLSIDMAFIQGGKTDNRAEAALIADNSNIYARGFTGQDYFENIIVAKNNSKVYLEEMGDVFAGKYFDVDETSKIYIRGVLEKDRELFELEKITNSIEVFTIPFDIPKGGVANFYYQGFNSSNARRHAKGTLYNFESSSAESIVVEDNSAPDVTFNLVGGKLEVEIAGSARINALLTVHLISAPDVTQTKTRVKAKEA